MKKYMIQPLDSIIREYVSHVSVVELKDDLQCIFYQDLHKKPHYSVGSSSNLRKITDTCEKYDIDIHFLSKDMNYLSPENGNIMILNDIKLDRHFKENFGLDLLIQNLKSGNKDKKRRSSTFTAGLSPDIASRWIKITITNKETGEVRVVNMEGFSDNIPQECKFYVGKSLNFVGNQLIEIMKNSRKVFDDNKRQDLFSSQLRNILLS